MARATTAKFEEFALEVEFTPGSGSYSNICGLTDVTINRSSNVDTNEIPDCDDESLPLAVEIAMRSQEVTISASGVWALGSDAKMLDWWYSGQTRNVRLRNQKVIEAGAAGATTHESGPALLINISNSRTKGQKITADVEIRFDGLPVRTLKSA